MHIIEDTRQQKGKHEIKHAYFSAEGVELVRCKLPFGDYAPVPPVSVDTKQDMEEIASNICGAEHKRFINECKAARAAGCHLIILVENRVGISTVTDVHKWVNPRTIFSDKCVQGPRLQKAMETISERYGVEFRFCRPEDAGRIIQEILKPYE
ncbi:MAG: ERCC4 domain-containing protein [Clostridia bacterium]|nr:ERCC4 domain-containing protein [Clostridia bacterium]